MSEEDTRRLALHQGLRALNENMKTLADLTEMAIREAVKSLLEGDLQRAESVLAIDREAYALTRVVQSNCVNLIALHAPVAKDLRLITTSLEITTDLERATRLARHICEVSQELADERIVAPPPLSTLTRMAELSTEMVGRAVQAFIHLDAASVSTIAQLDDAVDELHEKLFAELVARMTDGSLPIPVGARYVLVNRFLERISDHAVSIGERVVYLVTGTMPQKHLRRHASPPPKAQAPDPSGTSSAG